MNKNAIPGLIVGCALGMGALADQGDVATPLARATLGDRGSLERYGVELIGANLDAIRKAVRS